MGDYEKAEIALREAIQLVHRSGRLPVWVETQVFLGQLLVKRKQYNQALQVVNEAYPIADSMNQKVSIRSMERLYAVIYDALGNKIKSQEHYKRYVILNDSLSEVDQIQMAKEIEMKYEVKGINESNRLLKS